MATQKKKLGKLIILSYKIHMVEEKTIDKVLRVEEKKS